MNKFDRELEKYGEKLLAPLHSVPPMDTKVTAQIKQKYLNQGELFRKELAVHSNNAKALERVTTMLHSRNRPSLSILKALVGAVVALVILVGSTATVFASQNSLPGEPLYLIKSLSEDIRLSLSTSPQAKLNLTLNYTNRRMDEITTLVSEGKAISEQTSNRFNGELENALLLASQMEDDKMQEALGQIMRLAKSQGITMEELIDKLPEQAEPAIFHLKSRLQEQIELSQMGRDNPQAFRSVIRNRMHGQGPRHTPSSEGSNTSPSNPARICHPSERLNEQGECIPKEPGKSDQGNGNGGSGKSTPGNENHNPNR